MSAEIISALHAVLRATEVDTIILGIARLLRITPQFIAVFTAILAQDKHSRASRAMTVLKILRQDHPPQPAPGLTRTDDVALWPPAAAPASGHRVTMHDESVPCAIFPVRPE